LNAQHAYLEDNLGNKSSKRLWGSICFVYALLLSAILFYFTLINPEHTYAASLTIIQGFLIAGGSLLGIGVAEKLFNKRDKA